MDNKIMKMNVENKMCDVVTPTSYAEHPSLYDSQYTALKVEPEGIVLPIIGRTDYLENRVGIYPTSIGAFYNVPEQKSAEDYNQSHIIDFSDAHNMKDIIKKSEMVKSLESKILENSDNVTVIKYDENDEPEMSALKEAINSKNCDLNVYAQRFNGNFANDRRILTDTSITLTKLKKYGEALDMKISLTIEDKNDSVPNPIGKSITVELTGGGDNE